ncbi:hypothetical protein B0H14DRAFT_3172441 [Mycena olivaceomarginata]|nr:hypothetical protein B0H14DRAFT_3172441 [Mycena olivaceomarginata]
MSFVHDWGIPGIDIPVPPTRVGLSRDILTFRQLRFSPLGLYDLRRRLGVQPSEPGIFQRFRNRFLTSDIAWFAGGATSPLALWGMKLEKRSTKRMQHAVFDLATLWDRTFGGTTMIMHVEGTTVPNTPTEPQFLRAATYLPPGFTFIEAVGVPTVQQWRANALLRGWLLTQPGPVGALDALLGTAPPAPPSVPIVVIPDEDDGDYFDDLMARANYAEAESAERLEQIHNLEQQVDILIARVAAADALSADLQGQLLTTRRGTIPRVASQPRTVRTPASSSRQPPPYSPARANAQSPFPAPSINPRSPLAAPEYANDNQTDCQLDGLDLFIRQENLQRLAVDIKVVMRVYAPVKWYEELLALGIDSTIVSRLLDVAVAPE